MSTFTAHTPETAAPEGQKLLEDIQTSYGFIPNLFAYMAEAPVTVEAYLTLKKLIAKSSLSATQAQIALLAVSVENDCPFCSIAHRAVGKKAGVNPQTLAALHNKSAIEDPKDKALADLAKALVQHRGWVPDSVLQNFFAAGFTKQQVFEVILVVTIKTLSNYSNHLTQPEPNPEFVAML